MLINHHFLRLLFIILLLPFFSKSQPPVFFNQKIKRPTIVITQAQRDNIPLAIEQCDNGIDDDNNGLADENDFSCYYGNADQGECQPSKIIWGADGGGIYWMDTETGAYKFTRYSRSLNIYDLTWASNGKLYLLDAGNGMLWEIDPNSGDVTPAIDFQDYQLDNSLTSDNEGNLYGAGRLYSSPDIYGIIKINLATGIATLVADLTPFDVASAGDLCFLNGRLYLTCTESKMAVINTATGQVKISSLSNSTTEGSFGLVTLGDGFLYQCHKDKIYRIDPVTMTVSTTPFYDFKNDQIGFSGLSSYTEHCSAPQCNASLNISILSNQPYCSASGVSVKGNGNGIRGDAVYEWILPNGDTVRTNPLKATQKGKYYLSYYGVSDFCGVKDSVYLDIMESPVVDLGKDEILCDGATFNLIPQTSPDNINFVWQDGSTDSGFAITEPGVYWLEVTNNCGYASDTMMIMGSAVPEVDIGIDTAICPGTGIALSNAANKQPWDTYLWSDLSTGTGLTATAAGIYWLESSNSCGVTRDSIVISFKDSCSCFPFYPVINLGQDVELCNYETVKLSNSMHRDGFHYHWMNGSKEPVLNVKEPGIYWVDVSTYCATVRDSIVVNSKTNGCERNVFIPSAFTPNNDGMNDIFKPVVFGIPESYEFIIYNRWGQVVFFSKDIGKGWNGRINGIRQNSDVFVWNCRYKFSGEDFIFRKGTVMLIE